MLIGRREGSGRAGLLTLFGVWDAIRWAYRTGVPTRGGMPCWLGRRVQRSRVVRYLGDVVGILMLSDADWAVGSQRLGSP